MKLHLPKLLLTAVLAAAGVTQTTRAETYNLLESNANWTYNSTTYNSDTYSISASGWQGNKYATYVAGMDKYFVVDENNSLTFSLSYTIGGNDEVTWNSVQTFAFVGNDNAIVFGTETFGQTNVGTTHIGYGTTKNVTASHYGVTSNTPAVTLSPYEGAVRTNPGSYTINGTVTYANGSYSLTSTLSDGTNTYSSTTIDLGDSFEIGRFVFTSEGYNRSLTGLSITGNLVCRRYETTVSGSLAVGNATWSNDGNNVTTENINLSDNTAILGLTGLGDAASITFESGTNVAEIEVKEGNITLQGNRGFQAGILEVFEGASATIGSNMTVNSFVFNGGSIEIADKTVVSYTGSQVFMSGLKGTGTIEINKDAQIGAQNGETTSSDFVGIIVVKGGTLTLGSTGTQNYGHSFDLSEATIELAGGNAHYFGNRGELGTLKVSANAELGIFEMKGSDPRFTVGNVEVSAGKTLTINRGKVGSGDWNLRMEVSRLTGEGNLVLNANNKTGRVFTFDSVGTKTTAFGSITNNQTLNLGAEASSILNMGDVNNSNGILNIKGNLAGTSTISGGTINLKNGTSVSGNITFGSTVNMEAAMTNTGTLTFSEAVDLSNGITNTGTLNISKGYSSIGTLTNEGIFNLTGNVTISDLEQLKDSGQVTYSHNDGKDGYVTEATYYVVESTGTGANATVAGNSMLLIGSTEIGSITSSGSNLVVSISNETANSGVYYINTQDLTVDGTDTNVAANATGYYIAEGRTLTLSKNQNTTTMTASKILAKAMGAGNITVDYDFVFTNGSSSEATGILTIEEGHTLKLGEGTANVVSIASFNQVVLNGSTLKAHNAGTTIQNLTVNKASTLHFEDTSKNAEGVPNAMHLSGVTNLKADLDVTNGYKGRLIIDSLTGTGNLDIDLNNNAYVANGDSLIVDINEISNYSGIISYKPAVDTSVSDAAATYANNRITITSSNKGFSIGGLEVTGGKYENRTASGAATIDIGGDTTLGAVKLGQGSSLTIFNRDGKRSVTMDSLAVDGSAIIETKRDGNCHNGTISIDALKGTDATLTLKNGSKTTKATVFNLNGRINQESGEFSGTINLEGNAEGTSTRPVELILNNAVVAEKAVINFQNSSADENHSQYNQMYLKLGVDGAKVAGLSGETTQAAIIASASGTRTLHIEADKNANNTTNATITAGVNLMKSGAGKQTFSGSISFNGSLKVIEGELAFTATEALNVNGLHIGPEKGGVSPAASEGGNVGTLTVANGETAGRIVASGAVTLAGGATINGSLDMSKATDISFDVTSTSGAIALNGALTMSSTEAFVTALDLSSLTAGEMLTVFTGLTSFTMGEVSSDNFTEAVDLNTWSSTVAAGQYSVEYQVDNNVGSIVIINRMDAVPEPTTATLSLLALAGLCARRRRRA